MVERYLPFSHPRATNEEEELVAVLEHVSRDLLREYDLACLQADQRSRRFLYATFGALIVTASLIVWWVVSSTQLAATLALTGVVVTLILGIITWRLMPRSGGWTVPAVTDASKLWWRVVLFPVDEERAFWWDTLTRETVPVQLGTVPPVPLRLASDQTVSVDGPQDEARLLELLTVLRETPGRAIRDLHLPLMPNPRQVSHFQALARLWPAMAVSVPEEGGPALPAIPPLFPEEEMREACQLLAECARTAPRQRIELRRWRGGISRLASRAENAVRRAMGEPADEGPSDTPRPHPFDPAIAIEEQVRPLHQVVAAEMVPQIESEMRRVEQERDQLLARVRRDFELDRRRIEREHRSALSSNEAMTTRQEALIGDARRHLAQAEQVLRDNQSRREALMRQLEQVEQRMGRVREQRHAGTLTEVMANREVADLEDRAETLEEELETLQRETPRLHDRVSDRRAVLQAEQAAFERLVSSRHEAEAALAQELDRLNKAQGEAEGSGTQGLDATLELLRADLTFFRRLFPAFQQAIAPPLSRATFRPIEDEEGAQTLEALEAELVRRKAAAYQQWRAEMMTQLETLGRTMETTVNRITQLSLPNPDKLDQATPFAPVALSLPVWRLRVVPGQVPTLGLRATETEAIRFVAPLYARGERGVAPAPAFQAVLDRQLHNPTPEQTQMWKAASRRRRLSRDRLQAALQARARRLADVAETIQQAIEALT